MFVGRHGRLLFTAPTPAIIARSRQPELKVARTRSLAIHPRRLPNCPDVK